MKLANILKNYLSPCGSSLNREREREPNRSSSSSWGGIMRRLINAPVGALAIAVAVAIAVLLAACPAPGAGGPPSYLCANGTAVDGTTDVTTDAGRIRCAQCDRFYKLNGTAGDLGTTCEQIAVGEATRISAAAVSQFGVSEGFPFGLAAIGTTLYMVGSGTDRLYSLNTTDGTAIQVGSLAGGFGVGEIVPRGLAAIGDILYMVGDNNDRLYRLSTTTGTATQVGSLGAGFGVGETPRGLAAIGNTLYMAGAINDWLYSLNIDSTDGTSDGMAIQVGSAAGGFGVGENSPTGLAALGNTLYMVGWSNNVLYTIDTTDGSATRVGSVAAGFGVGVIVPTGLAAIDTGLYMVGSDTDALYALRYQ